MCQTRRCDREPRRPADQGRRRGARRGGPGRRRHRPPDVTWARARRRGLARRRAGSTEQGLVAGNRVVIATANRPEFVVAYLAVLRARLVAVPVNPRSATGELVRMVADSGARLVVADATTIDSARSVAAGCRTRCAGPTRSSGRARWSPGSSAVDAPPTPVRRRSTTCSAADPVPLPPSPRPRGARGPALHLRHVGAAARRDAQPPRAARQHRPGAPRSSRRWSAPTTSCYGVLPLFHVYGLNAVLGQVLRQHATPGRRRRRSTRSGRWTRSSGTA